MPKEKLNSIDDYERFLYETVEAWSPEQRIALAAAMAERWLHVYEAFSTAEEWGDPASLRRSLEAVWNHLQGRPLTRADIARYTAQVEDSTPHMDDFDDEAALAAAIMVQEALRSCGARDNSATALQSILSGFEAVAPEWEMDPEEQPRLWRQIAVRQEFKKQLKLVEQIGAITHFDDGTIKALRKKLTSKEYIGEITPAAKPVKGPITITNQTAFEQYRRMVELDLKTKNSDWWEKEYEPGSTIWAIMVFAEWAGRYTRRRDTINGSYGQLADTAAHQALVARQRARDGLETAIPEWEPELGEAIVMALQNRFNGFDITSPDQPHGYGPSLRALWAQGRRLGQPASEAWRQIIDWGRHRPAAWETEDRRKKRGLAHTTPALGALLARELTWNPTGDPEHPWATEVEGERWLVRLNDFPDDFMYSLIIGGVNAGDFHDWPETWQRG
jgi:uncharacterized protein YjaG (DUF416 family)